MDPQLRLAFNGDFAPEKYAVLLRCVNETEKWPADFRISETPIFLTDEFVEYYSIINPLDLYFASIAIIK